MNKDIKQNLILIFLFILLLSLAGYIIYDSYSKKLALQQKIRQLEETKKQIEEIDKQLERLKNFNEEEYAEKVMNLLDVNSHFSTSTDINIKGIEIIYRGDSKLVINHKEGYQVKVPKEFILNRTYSTDNIHFDDLSRIGTTAAWKWSVIDILTAVDKNDNDLKSSFNFFIQRFKEAMNNPEAEIININGEKFYRIPIRTDEGGNYYPDALFGYEYYLLKDKKIFVIFTENTKNYSAEDLDKFIRTFKLIKNESL